jgi:hypothetical protein
MKIILRPLSGAGNPQEQEMTNNNNKKARRQATLDAFREPEPVQLFRTMLESDQIDFGVAIKMPITIDEIRGVLKIIKVNNGNHPSSPHGYLLDFEFNKMCCTMVNPIHDYYKDFDALADGIKELVTIRILGEDSMTPARLEKYLTCRNGVYQLMGREAAKCYVCLEDSFGHETQCHHAICMQCYVKSLDKQSNTFQCGICRAFDECC